MTTSLSLAPLVPLELIVILAAAGLFLAGVALLRGGRGWLLRVFVLVVLVAALANPQVVREERKSQRDIAVIAVDRSASQEVGDRRAETDTALAMVREQLSQFDDLDVRIIEVSDGPEDGLQNSAEIQGANKDGNKDGGTRMFSALARETVS